MRRPQHNLQFCTDYAGNAVKDADVIFIAVGYAPFPRRQPLDLRYLPRRGARRPGQHYDGDFLVVVNL